MQTLSMMTLAALALGGATYAVDAAWAQPAPCESRTVSVYFEQGEADFNAYSQEIVERLAAEARSCAGAQVIARAPAGPLAAKREAALHGAFEAAGVKLVLTGASPLARSSAAGGETLSGRTASIRIASGAQQIG